MLITAKKIWASKFCKIKIIIICYTKLFTKNKLKESCGTLGAFERGKS